jgi:hypothetical protein
MMQKLGMQEGEAIEHPWVTKAIENAQRKVEGRNFDIRKQLLEYDDVANDQRKVIYQQRRELMDGDDISETVQAMRTTCSTPDRRLHPAAEPGGAVGRAGPERGAGGVLRRRLADPAVARRGRRPARGDAAQAHRRRPRRLLRRQGEAGRRRARCARSRRP